MNEVVKIDITTFTVILSFAIVGALWLIEFIYRIVRKKILESKNEKPILMDLTNEELDRVMSLVNEIHKNKQK